MDAEIQLMATYRNCLDVNFLGAVKMCQVFLPLLRRSRGRIVNVSSLAGRCKRGATRHDRWYTAQRTCLISSGITAVTKDAVRFYYFHITIVVQTRDCQNKEHPHLNHCFLLLQAGCQYPCSLLMEPQRQRWLISPRCWGWSYQCGASKWLYLNPQASEQVRSTVDHMTC